MNLLQAGMREILFRYVQLLVLLEDVDDVEVVLVEVVDEVPGIDRHV